MNFYTKLISKLDPQTQLPVFKSIQIQLACQACIDAEKAHECVHLQHLIPRWQVNSLHTDACVQCTGFDRCVLLLPGTGRGKAPPPQNHHERPPGSHQLGARWHGRRRHRPVLQAGLPQAHVCRHDAIERGLLASLLRVCRSRGRRRKVRFRGNFLLDPSRGVSGKFFIFFACILGT